MKKLFTLLSLLAFSFFLNAQQRQWTDVRDYSNNFFEIRNAFNENFRGVDLATVKGWKPFKRWEYYYESRTYPHGDLSLFRNAMVDFSRQLQRNQISSRANASNWIFIGPDIIPSNGGGAGRLNHVKPIPGTSNQYYAASSGGGIWKFNGSTWSTSTDFLGRIGFADVVINPDNTNIVYAASGDNDNADAPCIGMFKSIDGGNSWNPSGLTNVSRIYKLLMNPSDANLIFAATSSGIYRSVDGGNNWGLVSSVTNIRDMEYKPGDVSVVYAVNRNDGSLFYRSTDGGASFSNAGVGTGLPASSNGRGAIAVTPQDANYIYMIIGDPSNNGFKGVYRSTDGGVNWTTQATTPNLLGWSNSGNDTGGQQWYDLSIAVSPTNKELVIVGGVNVWRSMNGGTNWSIIGHWTGSGAPYIHADIHDLSFDSNGITVYAGCDGGIFRKDDITTGSSWADLSSGLAVAQMYRMGQSTQSQNKVITGWQDNGSSLWTGPATWTRVMGGDGMECLIDFSTDTYQYGTIYYGRISRSSNSGVNFSTTIAQSGGTAGTVNEDGDWVTPFIINPRNPQAIYVGKTRIYKTTDRGASWTAHPLIGLTNSRIDAIAVAPSDTNVIYASKSGQIWRSGNDGANYTEITSGLPGLFITYIAVDESNPDKVYVSLSGTGGGNKVFMSTNGGSSWINISTGLPNISANVIVLDTNSTVDAMYAGMDAGVYYRDNNNTTWTAFNTNLPNVEITELEIQYAAGKIRASTYGRGLWESNLESASSLFLTASFTSSAPSICRGASIQFTDNSTGNPSPNSWSWSFPGGTPSSSSLQNPSITYNTNGTFPVTLTTGNGVTSQTITLNNYITVISVTPSISITGDNSVCAGSTATYVASGTNLGLPTYTWKINGNSAGVNASTFSSSTIPNGAVISAEVVSTALCAQPATAQSNTITLTVKPLPPAPVITATYGLLTSSNASGNQWMLNGTEIPGATGVTYNAIKDGNYSVKTTINGCTSQSSASYDVKIENLFKVYPVPNRGDLTVAFYIPENANKYSLRIVNTRGQVVYREDGSGSPGVLLRQLDIKRLASDAYQIRIITGLKKYNRGFVKAN